MARSKRSEGILRLLDFLFTAAIIVVLFYIYFEVSRKWGIIITAIMIGIILLTYIPQFKRKSATMRYSGLIKVLEKYPIIRERDLIEVAGMTPNDLHYALSKLSEEFNGDKGKHLIIFIPNQYLYISSKILDKIIHLLSDDNSYKGLKKIQTAFSLTNEDIDMIINKLREIGRI